jgi:hypothetical protein
VEVTAARPFRRAAGLGPGAIEHVLRERIFGCRFLVEFDAEARLVVSPQAAVPDLRTARKTSCIGSEKNGVVCSWMPKLGAVRSRCKLAARPTGDVSDGSCQAVRTPKNSHSVASLRAG